VNPCHAAALALVGWYLMVPPPVLHSSLPVDLDRRVHSSARARGLRFNQLQRRALAPADALEDPINGEHAALEVDILPAQSQRFAHLKSER
jgi:hypothetical protein